MPKTYAFRLYADSELSAARNKLELVLSAWSAEWFPLAREQEVVVLDLGSREGVVPHDKGWVIFPSDALDGVAINRRADLLKCVANAIAGEAAADESTRLPLSPIVADVVDQALIELAAKISGVSTPVSAKDTPWGLDVQNYMSVAKRLGGGALLCTFKLNEYAFAVILGSDAAPKFVPSKATAPKGQKKLAPLLSAVAKRDMRASLILGHAELSVAEFVGLNTGDVILLDRKIGQSFDLCTATGKLIGGVQIGSQGSHIAAAIVRKS